jgi:hypothetical protein
VCAPMPREVRADFAGKRSTRMWCQPSAVSRVSASTSLSSKPSATSLSSLSPISPSMSMKACMSVWYCGSGQGAGPWQGHCPCTRESVSGRSLVTVKISE